jgi:hypothetical protein
MTAWLDGNTVVATLIDKICQPDVACVHRICEESQQCRFP